MPGQYLRRTGVKGQLLLVLTLCALLARAWIPSGWMPDRTSDGYAISLCTGMGAVTVWVDDKGAIHKNKPVKSGTDDQPCAFAGMFHLAALPQVAAVPVGMMPAIAIQGILPATAIAVGRGLAAPPPPPTGPPASL
ncbi:hypothetical protein C1T17_00410 [Sphingobium sp. SCG-1]|uniref:hypothetical protein n=1 Tax=Sphingobium sp. SCG-1 TaxID=2072936 RepID=UPI000CD6947A|nr:hypothetical protein [Sphingobium sp. SCG-1]AUW56771.1 hypothetical protein C1T17_00410 [Sphingobium sp. SCG-1]